MLCPICGENRLVFYVSDNKVVEISELPRTGDTEGFTPCREYVLGTEIFEALAEAYWILRAKEMKEQDATEQYRRDMAEILRDFDEAFFTHWETVNAAIEKEKEESGK